MASNEEITGLGLQEVKTKAEVCPGYERARNRSVHLALFDGFVPLAAHGARTPPPQIEKQESGIAGQRQRRLRFQAVFTKQGAAASQVAAAKLLDTISRLSGMAG